MAEQGQDKEQGQERRNRWLFVGRFTPEPTGKLETVTPERAARPFEAAPLALVTEISDPLGPAGGRRRVEIAFGKLSDLRVADLIRANPDLAAVRAIGEELAAGKTDATAAAGVIAARVGEGPLADAVRAGGPDRRRGRDAIERAVLGAAREALGSPTIAALETAWRGLRLVAERASAGDIEIQILDTTLGEAAARIEEILGAAAPFDRPDILFVTDPIVTPAALRAVAGAGADYSVPVIVEGAPAIAGAASAKDIATLSPEAPAPSEWQELRADDVARWCCVTVNRAVLASDGAGAAARVALGSPVFALGALLAQSYGATGGPGRIFGAGGGLVAPGTHEVDAGRGEPLAIALEAFVSIDAQTRLAARGLLALGGPRNSDRIQIASAPTFSSAKDAAPLPAQIISARTVRFAQWARDQMPPETKDADVVTIMEQAATALLFPNPDVAKLSAVVTPLEGGRRAVVVRTLARGEWVGIPLDVTFALPLPT